MKLAYILIASILIPFGIKAQITYKGLPCIKASSAKASYFLNHSKISDGWIISPEVPADSLSISVMAKTLFAFKTDKDSLSFQLVPGKSFSFYVQLNDTLNALTVIYAKTKTIEKLVFDEKAIAEKLKFVYESNIYNPYLNKLKNEYPIDSLVAFKKTDTEKALSILHWVHRQWKHNGGNEPKKSDAISILQEAKEGKLFRCVEYGIVATACLNAVGLNARVLNLKTKDVETTPSGAGHVLLEVYLNDLQKWVLLDGQFDAMPVLNGVPLNAVEFQNAINTHCKELQIITASDLSKDFYIGWIYPYLYYFDINFDNREGEIDIRFKINGKSNLMLVPKGAKNPTIFQRKYKIDYCEYTNSLADFYRKP